MSTNTAPRRAIHAHTMTVDGTAAQVFPLLCPVREHEWIEHWTCDLVFSDSGFAELDCIFKTGASEDGSEEIWIVSRYDPPRRIEFVRVSAVRAIRYSIDLVRETAEQTEWRWRQVITSLGPEGDDLVSSSTQDAFSEHMQQIERALNHFLHTGTRMSSALKP